jgi:hypothetical protein
VQLIEGQRVVEQRGIEHGPRDCELLTVHDIHEIHDIHYIHHIDGIYDIYDIYDRVTPGLRHDTRWLRVLSSP